MRYFSTAQGLPEFGKYDWKDPLNLQSQLSAEELKVQVRSPPHRKNRWLRSFDVHPLFPIRWYLAQHQCRLNGSLLVVRFYSTEAACVLLLPLFATCLLPSKPRSCSTGLATRKTAQGPCALPSFDWITKRTLPFPTPTTRYVHRRSSTSPRPSPPPPLPSLLPPAFLPGQLSAEHFAQKVLAPQVVAANRHGKFDREILTGMGAAGLLGCTLKGYGCAGVGHVAYGLVARWVPPACSYPAHRSVEGVLLWCCCSASVVCVCFLR